MQNQFIITPFFLDEEVPKLESLIQPGWIMNKPALPGGNKQSRMSSVHKALAELVEKKVIQGDRPVSIGGDCCTAIGVLAGLQRSGINPRFIWFDAHGDFNTWETTPSSFLGGMPLAMIVGLGEQSMPDAVGLTSFAEDQVILTGARDLDPAERELVRKSEMLHLQKVTDILEHSFKEMPLYVHFDTDVINPDEAPAMNYPATGGPSVKELQDVFRYLSKTGKVAAVSMSSWNPDLDKDGNSRAVCMKLLNILVDTE
jgi:arginase